jgi:hypothetical protein
VSTSESSGGFFSAPTRKETQAYVAEQFSASGGVTRIIQTSGWARRQVKDKDGTLTWEYESPFSPSSQFSGLVAQLGLEGWEPMPLVQLADGYSTRDKVVWYFKRQLPDI